MGIHEDDLRPQEPLSDFIISRPELQAGLTEVIPLGEVPSHYINRYEAEFEVRCAFCDKHTPHRKGFTAQMADGRIALCGRDCAEKYFGKEVADVFEKKLEEQIKKASRRKVLQRTLAGVPLVLERLTDDVLKLERQALAAAQGLNLEFRNSGILNRLTDQGDYERVEARRRWIEREDEHGRTQRVPFDEEVVTLRVAGAVVMRTGDRAKPQLASARADLQALAKSDPDADLSDLVLDRMGEMRSSIIAHLQNGVRFLDHCSRFYTKDNIRQLQRLAKDANLHVDGIALHKRPDGFDLLITQALASWEDPIYADRAPKKYRLGRLEDRPAADDLIAPLRQEQG